MSPSPNLQIKFKSNLNNTLLGITFLLLCIGFAYVLYLYNDLELLTYLHTSSFCLIIIFCLIFGLYLIINSKIDYIRISDSKVSIHRNPFLPRKKFNAESIEEVVVFDKKIVFMLKNCEAHVITDLIFLKDKDMLVESLKNYIKTK